MNSQKKKDCYIASKREIGVSYGTGLIKLSNETLEHFLVKCQVAYYLYKNGWEVHSECQFRNNKGRADLVALHKNGSAWCIEITHSESDKKLSQKDYPFPIIKVPTKGFIYNKFCI
jgi:hypothetical protein